MTACWRLNRPGPLDVVTNEIQLRENLQMHGGTLSERSSSVMSTVVGLFVNIVLAVVLVPILILVALDQLTRFGRTQPWADRQLARIMARVRGRKGRD